VSVCSNEAMEALTQDQLGMRYGIADASDMDEMVQLLGVVFSRRDPPAVAMAITPAEFETLVRLFCPAAASGRLTVIARSAETGRMAGALLTEDSAAEPPGGVEALSPKFDPIFDILGSLDSEYRDQEAVRPGERLHLFLLGVDEAFAGRGIAQRLVEACLRNGLNRGYRRAVTEATNLTSQHVFRKQGFVERVRRSYQDYRYQGEAVFASIREQGGPILMGKVLA
jgi:ribosomal protein S18 acetylase RimI-like enzyme